MQQRTFKQIWAHLFIPTGRARQCFNAPVRQSITEAIDHAEKGHQGEIRFVVENALSLSQLWAGIRPRHRAQQLFAEMGVWDTADNSGILIYVLLAERRIEIIADRGISQRVPASVWQSICETMQNAYQQNQWLAGTAAGIQAAGDTLRHAMPYDKVSDQLSNHPVIR